MVGWAGTGRGIVINLTAPVCVLNLILGLGHQLSLVILVLNGLRLDSHHLELEHLHGHGLVVSGRRHDVSRVKSRYEGGGIGIEGVLGLLLVLLLGKVIVTIDCSSHGVVPGIEKVMGHICKLVIFFLLWVRCIIGMRGEARKVERGTRSGGVRKISRDRTNTACAEAIEKRGTVAIVGIGHEDKRDR
jgi:hypothetical protein